MVNLFHAHGIRVIIDGVFNHCGWQFHAFEDVVEKGRKTQSIRTGSIGWNIRWCVLKTRRRIPITNVLVMSE